MSSRAYAGRRPAPTRVGRRVGPSRVRWDRIGRVALVLVLFGVLVSYLNPVVNLVDAWRDSKAGEERLVELKAQNAGLRDQVERAGSTATLEREARKLGMVKPGERAYVIEGLSGD
jgi:cell division protein FtsB